MEDNCMNCMFSCDSNFTLSFHSILGEMMKCSNENSPYFEDIVNQDTSCRLFRDYDEYIKMKDRKENLTHLIEKMNGKID